MKNNSFLKRITCLFALVSIIKLGGGGINLLAQCPVNILPNDVSSNAGIQTLTVPKKLTIGGNISCPDIALQLRYDPEIPYWGILALTTPGNYQSYTSIAQPPTPKGDLVLSAENARDVIITSKNESGKIRFATTQVPNLDEERMTIIPTGQVGIWNTDPKNLLSTRTTIGMDFWNSNESFQDIRFNCYAEPYFLGDSEKGSQQDTINTDNPLQVVHKNIQGGFSSIIQSISKDGEGKLILATSGKNENPSTNLNFFQLDPQSVFQPRGIMIQSFCGKDSVYYASIGLATMPDYLSRVKIQGRTSDSTMNALKIVNWNNHPLFTVRNDGLVCVKEIMVQLSGTPCWPDFVFNDNYKLLELDVLERKIKSEKRLPDMPTSKEVEENGINLGEMQAKLLQKIEELTLYVISLKKENDKLISRLKKIESERKD